MSTITLAPKRSRALVEPGLGAWDEADGPTISQKADMKLHDFILADLARKSNPTFDAFEPLTGFACSAQRRLTLFFAASARDAQNLDNPERRSGAPPPPPPPPPRCSPIDRRPAALPFLTGSGPSQGERRVTCPRSQGRLRWRSAAARKRTFPRSPKSHELPGRSPASSKTSVRNSRPEDSRRDSASRNPAYRSCPLAFCAF